MYNHARSSVSVRTTKKYYPSNVMNQIIVNAISGGKYPYRVGSKESLRLFKVTDTTGDYSLEGKKKYIDYLKVGQEKMPNHYYFSNPAEYMQDRGFHRHAESCDGWGKYQKSLLDGDNNVVISVYNSKKRARQHLQMQFDSRVDNRYRE